MSEYEFPAVALAEAFVALAWHRHRFEEFAEEVRSMLPPDDS